MVALPTGPAGDAYATITTTRDEYKALYGLALEARKLRRDLERVGWPIAIDASIKFFDEALARWEAVDKVIDRPREPR